MDDHDNPVSGATVIFSAEPASASVSGGTQTTNSDGIATVGDWTLGTVTGTNHLTATSGPQSVTFSAQATVSAEAPTISTINPSVGLNTGTISGVTITGNHFSTTGGNVSLTKSGEDPITGTCSRSTTALNCSFALLDKDDGSWNVVVVNDDGKSVTKTNGFTIYKKSSSDITISSISPESGKAGDDISFTITGEDFITSMTYVVYLYNSDVETNISAEDIEVKSKTSIKGKFDLDDDAELDNYYLCIRDGFGNIECKKKAFTITTNKEGTIEIESSPSGATIYIDNVANGTTPKDIDILVGSYKIVLKKSGYQDWSKTVNVDEEEEVEVDASLSVATTTAPTTARVTTSQTTVPRTTARPATTVATARTTARIPTTLPQDTPTTAEESPVEPALVIGTIALAAVILRKP